MTWAVGDAGAEALGETGTADFANRVHVTGRKCGIHSLVERTSRLSSLPQTEGKSFVEKFAVRQNSQEILNRRFQREPFQVQSLPRLLEERRHVPPERPNKSAGQKPKILSRDRPG